MTTATNQLINDPVVMEPCLTARSTQSDYHAKLARFADDTTHQHQEERHGFAAFLARRRLYRLRRAPPQLPGQASTSRRERRIRVLVSTTEFGQGTNTILCQVAARDPGPPLRRRLDRPADTSIVPNCGPTVAWRTAMIVGKLVETAATEMRQLCSMPDY